jgi:hypothetical protein
MASLFDTQYPEALRDRERAALRQRREMAGVAVEGAGDRQERPSAVGLAISGGGIRSATFSLGFLQALAAAQYAHNNRKITLRDVDLLSTVSGGGYIGAFLGALYVRNSSTSGDSDQRGPAGSPNQVNAVENELSGLSSSSVQWLRENGRYLAPNGSGDQWLAGAMILRNWISLGVVISSFVLAVFMLGHTLTLFLLSKAVPVLPSLAERIEAATSSAWPIYWSPLLLAPAAVLLFWAAPFGWAYWLGRWHAPKPGRMDHWWVWTSTVVVTLAATIVLKIAGVLQTYRTPMTLVAIVGTLTLIVSAILTRECRDDNTRVGGDRRFRNLASRRLTGALITAAVLLGLALVDSLGRTVYVFAQHKDLWRGLVVAIAPVIGLFITITQKISTLLDRGEKKKRVTVSMALIASIAGIVVAIALLGGLSAISHGIARHWEKPDAQCEASTETPVPTVSLNKEQQIVVGTTSRCGAPAIPPLWFSMTIGATLGLIVIAWLFGRSLPFVNLSSLTQFYSARLSRTYVGASNPNRHDGVVNMTEEVKGDDFDLPEYTPHAGGGPLHLINVTLNETVGGHSQIEDRDRKGLAMAIGPAGISVGVRHHAQWNATPARLALKPIRAAVTGDSDNSYHVWSNVPPEQPVVPKPLSLSQWVAISGAAVAPGMGAQTSLGLSLLLGVGNVRLGYWWDSAAIPARQGGAPLKWSIWFQRAFAQTFPVHSALMQEFLAQFHGTHQRHWFLSDGGHFENTGAYELLRRRVPLIVICDNGADPGYAFEDLANLVRKARLDFCAEVRFLLPSTDQQQMGFGTFTDLRRSVRPEVEGIDLGVLLSKHHLLAAKITYPDKGSIESDPINGSRPSSIVVVVKPSLTGDEPLDVLQYAAAHPDFPQEATSDQFFDEAQWESYRRLGQHVGTLVAGIPLRDLADNMPDDRLV